MFEKKDALILFLVVLLSSLLAADQLLAQGEAVFRARQDIEVGGTPSVSAVPQVIAVADVNGDGQVDLVVAKTVRRIAVGTLPDAVLSILLGNGDGSFHALQDQLLRAGGYTPTCITVADFNGDGNPDLAVGLLQRVGGYSARFVRILLGNGAGSFYPVSADMGPFDGGPGHLPGSDLTSITVADFNGDAIPDLAVSGIVTLLGVGDGTFIQPQSFLAPGNSITVADFNGDGKPDLATSSGTILINTTTLALRVSFQTYSVAVGSNPRSVTAADFNADGKPDLAVANSDSNNVSILLGNGDGTFRAAQNFAVGSAPQSVTVADFNGDGQLDLAVANGSGNVSILLGNGDGTFRAPQNVAVGNQPTSVVTADFNGDGQPDLAVANNGSGNVSILLGNGDGTLRTAQVQNVAGGPVSVTVGDFNGDAIPDLAVLSSNNVSILLGNGDGTFRAPQNFAAGTQPTSVTVGDFNADGKLDLAVANFGSNNISLLLGNGDGTFGPAQNFTVGTRPTSVTVGDFNADGKPDLAVANGGSGNVSVQLGNGDGTIRAPRDFAAGSNPRFVAVADFNADGKPDLAVANGGSNNISILLGNGDGTFRAPQSVGFVGTVTSIYSLAVGDFNGDGKPDLAVPYQYFVGSTIHSIVAILLGNGDGTFRAPSGVEVKNQARAITVGDFNGDGLPDLAVTGSDSLSILLGDSNGSFGPPQYFAVGAGPQSVAVGDFNGDGKPDLAAVGYRDAGSGNVSILINDKPTSLPLAAMSGDQEVPPVTTTGSAIAAFLAPDRYAITWLLILTDIDPATITGASVHVAPAGQTGPAILRMTPLAFDQGMALGTWTAADLTPGGGITTLTQAIDALRTGRCYANIRTMAQPDGFVRGQINLVRIQ
jgi:hypothetical protein